MTIGQVELIPTPPVDTPWWAWALLVLTALFLGAFSKRFFDYLVKRTSMMNEAKQVDKQAVRSNHQDVIEEWRSLSRTLNAKVAKLETKAEAQDKTMKEVLEREQKCLLHNERLSIENEHMRERQSSYEEALQKAGIPFRSTAPYHFESQDGE